MKANKTFLLVTGIIIICCDPGINTERTNTLDPESSNYTPIFISLKANLSETDKTVHLEWINRASKVDGFLVEKRFSNEERFFPIDTTDLEYSIDTSTQFSVNMQYRVNSFLLIDQTLDVRYSLTFEDTLNYGEIKNFFAFPQGSALSIQWAVDSIFDREIAVEYKLRGSNNWFLIESISDTDSEFYNISFEGSPNGSYDFRVTLYLENYEGELEAFDQKEYQYN